MELRVQFAANGTIWLIVDLMHRYKSHDTMRICT